MNTKNSQNLYQENLKKKNDIIAKSLHEQIEKCRQEVANWPDWMRQEVYAPNWMQGWDD